MLARRMAPWVLSGWCTVLLLGYLLPCCASAAARPDEQALYVEEQCEDFSQTSIGDAEQVQSATRCPCRAGTVGTVFPLAVASSSRVDNPDPDAAGQPVRSDAVRRPIYAGPLIPRHLSAAPPIYLSTQRLRI